MLCWGSEGRDPWATLWRPGGRHVYREGFDDRWAYPLDPDEFRNPHDLVQALIDFCHSCSVEPPADFQEDLF